MKTSIAIYPGSDDRGRGALQIGDGTAGHDAALVSNIVNYTSNPIVFNLYGNQSYAGAISGSGAGMTKSGTGTLTLNGASTYAGPTVITQGTLQLAGQPPGVIHHWNFNNSLADPVGGSTATIYGNTTLGANQVTVNGNGTTQVSYINLGTNILPTTNSPATVELWVTENQVENWSRVLDFGSTPGGASNVLWSWTNGTGNPGVVYADGGGNWNAATFTPGTEYHLALVFTPNGNNSNVAWYQMDTSGKLITSGSATPNWNLSQLIQNNMWLGRSEYNGDADANASYDDVRIWNTALTQAQLSAMSIPGPSGGNVLPATTPVQLAAGATLDLNGSLQQVASLSDYAPGSSGSVINSNSAVAAVLALSPTGSSTFSGTISSAARPSAW